MFAKASLTLMYKDVKDKIKNLSETTPTLDWKKSKDRLVSTMSTLESMLVILAKTMIATRRKARRTRSSIFSKDGNCQP
jgi:hypothetical protein